MDVSMEKRPVSLNPRPTGESQRCAMKGLSSEISFKFWGHMVVPSRPRSLLPSFPRLSQVIKLGLVFFFLIKEIFL